MKKYMVFFIFFLNLCKAYPGNICEITSIENNLESSLILKIGKTSIYFINFDYGVIGWEISKYGKWFIVYGTYPTTSKFDSMSSQEIDFIMGSIPELRVSIFKDLNFNEIWHSEEFQDGGGIYKIAMDNSEEKIFIGRPSGVFEISTKNKNNKSYKNIDLSDKNYHGTCENYEMK
ncbi:hypothetical protein FHW67_003004 [Herbaspirillum sp. Sphag1AN]|uniref:hypothetical protein n=1 Tax=unclassified Herbaspirillum TaxID=2624150 RepID=UPI00160F2F3F|nr:MULTISPECIES: hypothetical protein [unclassified Herbaspirillum]MBB3213703.1 hypothetical protein [Herbaspirillum sp. Sphag1AN]MBB3246900.1 hypothetical protein [Herbaspirillum sp. Sphag64]